MTLNKPSRTIFRLSFIAICLFAISACSSSSDSKKSDAQESMQAEQSALPSPSLTPTPTLTPFASSDTSKAVMENEAFRIFEPAPNKEVGTTFTVKGQARVFEGVLSYTFEDGHKILAEGNEHAAAGAPEWADFEFTVAFEKPTNPVGALIIFEKSAKDGSSIHQLMIPLKFNADIIEPLQ